MDVFLCLVLDIIQNECISLRHFRWYTAFYFAHVISLLFSFVKESGLENVMFLFLYVSFANPKYVILISQLWCKICFLLSILLWKISHSWFNSGTQSSGCQNSDIHTPLWHARSFPTLYNLMFKWEAIFFFTIQVQKYPVGGNISELTISEQIYHVSVSQTSLSKWMFWHSSCSTLY